MELKDKLRLVQLVRARVSGGNAQRVLDFVGREDVMSRDKAPAGPEILFTVFKEVGYKTLKEAREAIQNDEDSRVKKAAQEIRVAIELVMKSPEGQRSPISISLPKKQYGLHFHERDVATSRLWQPYIDGADKTPVLMLYEENVSFRSLDHRYFVRHLDINDVTVDPASKLPFLPEEHLPLQPSRQFVASGNVGTLLSLTRWFERIGVRTDHAIAHHNLRKQAFMGHNLIMLGTKRTFPLIEEFSNGFNFEVVNEGIINRQPVDEDPASDHAKGKAFYEDDFSAPGFILGLVVRNFDDRLNSTITIITSNNSRFHEAAASYLTQDASAAELLEELTGSSDGDLPKRFEVLLKVPIERHEDNPMPAFEIELLAKRVYPARKGAGEP